MSEIPGPVQGKASKLGSSEGARRAEAVARSAGHLRMEGMYVSEFVKQLERRYIEGEIEIEEMIASVKIHYGIR